MNKMKKKKLQISLWRRRGLRGQRVKLEIGARKKKENKIPGSRDLEERITGYKKSLKKWKAKI